ncbi:MAG: S8 family serine peptidase [Bacteroidaceae bacterium]|nr:S8 family serine peptidase [Bacteroidaceae bacterium]
MRRYISLLLGILGFVPIIAQQSDYYYYYNGERIDLTVDSTRLFVVSEGEFQPQSTARANAIKYNISKSARSYVYNNVVPLQKQRTVTPEVYFSTLDVLEGTTASQYSALIDKVKEEKNVWQVLPSFTSNGKPLNVTNNFYVELKSADDFTKLQQMAVQYGLQIIGNNEFMPLWYTLSCNAISSVNSIEAANLFLESQLFACSEPELLHSVDLYSDPDNDEPYINDYYYPVQWNLKNIGQYGSIAGIDINVEGAWEITKGNGVVVAVFDEGSHMSHADLNNQFSKSYDAVTGNSYSVILDRSSHGTNCAGVIGAIQNNGIGSSGVAPEVELMDISINLNITNGFSSQQAANGFCWAKREGADIISCSWGGVNHCKIIDSAINQALCDGRDGNGCIIVFAAGNDGLSTIEYPGSSNPKIIAVGGITPMGKRAVGIDDLGDGTSVGLYSNYGELLDVVAPSILIPTTSVFVDEWGFPFDRYKSEFDGTSAACPHVAGVAALMLSVNPNLTVEDVEYIIGKTARRVRPDLYTYQKDSIHAHGKWNIEMGYGLIDATAAVKMAQKYHMTTYVEYIEVNTGEHEYFGNSYVEIENVTVNPGGQLHIDEEKRAILKSSVQVKRGGHFTIYNTPVQ